MKKWAIALWLPALTVALTCRLAAAADVFDAVRAGDVEKVQALLQADPKVVEARTGDGNTPLHVAALEGHTAVAQALLDGHAQVNARGLREETPLHMAIYDGHRAMVGLLLANRADVNAPSATGETPLHVAARKGHREVVELLLAEKADLRLRDKSGRTAKAVAAESGHWEIVALLTLRVGGLGDPQRFVFEGAETFSADALREALQGASDFFVVSHPLAPLDVFLETLEKKLQLGYQHKGFPEAQVAARPDVPAGLVRIQVREGPRYLCGGVKVIGAQRMPAKAIVERLTDPPDAAALAQTAFRFMDQAPSSHALEEGGGNQPLKTKAFWAKGTPILASEVDLRDLKTVVINTMREHGLLSPRINVSVEPDQAAQTAELRVEVIEEGPSGVIDRIEVTGNRANKTEALLRYLDVEAGTPLTGKVIERIEERLWRAARFLDYKVRVGAMDGSGRFPLQLQVVEYADAPPLDQKFSRSEQALLRMREWLARLDESREDMVVSLTWVTNDPVAVECVVSPVSGIALELRHSGDETKDQLEYAVVLRGGLLAVYSLAGGRKLKMACPRQQLLAYARESCNPSATNGSPFNMDVGVGFSGEGEGVTSAPPYRFELTLPPAACVGLVHRLKCDDRLEGEILTRSNATFLLKLNTQTGRLIELQARGDDWRFDLHFERGALERALKRIEADTAGLPDAYDTNAPLSSAVAFLVEEAVQSRLLKSLLHARKVSEGSSRLPAMLRRLNLTNILSPLNQLLPPTLADARGETGFWIPEEPGAVPGSGNLMVDMVGSWLLRHSDQLFEAGSWARALLREAALVVQKQGSYTEQVLAEVYESSETGPLGCWVAASLVGRADSPWRQKFAARGLERLSAEYFRRDCRLLLTGRSVLSQCFEELAATLGRLSEEELAAVVEKQPAARAAFIRDSAQRLREAKQQAALDVIAPALDLYWQAELKEAVAAGLRKQAFDPAAAYQQALKLREGTSLSSDDAQAAVLFRQAAEAGHPGAQFYLARLYEKGQGVNKERTWPWP